MYDYEYYYEPSIMDEIFAQFQEKCKEVLLEDTNSKIKTIVQSNEYYKKENEQLRSEIKNLTDVATTTKKELANNAIVSMILNNLKDSIKNAESHDKTIYSFLNLLFKKDYNETVGGDVPLWIGALTQYYSHKDEVTQILQLLEVKLPKNIENFRLPIDWNEEELDIFFNTMHNHCNCNCCVYEDNLRFWSSRSLWSVEEQCKTHYSEIPWQYVLRNPLLKQEKYLIQIGKHGFEKHSYWDNFYKIDQYLDLTEKEIKIILNNIEYTMLTSEGKVAEFVLRNLKFVENKNFLNKIYSLFHNSYDFKYGKKILNMPYEYIKMWASDHKNDITDFVKKNKDVFTIEQQKELLFLALDL